VLASLNHPRIAAIHGVEDSGSAPALVIEFVDGPTLADRLTGGAIPIDEAIPIARQIAEAIEAAHEAVDTPLWSPDGRKLAFWSRSAKGLFIVGVDSSDRIGPLATAENGELYPNAWSPDGKTIAFIRERPVLNLFGVSTSAPYTVRPLAIGAGALVEAAFSPNGRWLAHVAFDGRVPEIVVGPVGHASRYWPVAPSGRNPSWTQDGREVIYLEEGAIHHVLIDPDTGMPAGRPGKLLDLPSAANMTRQLDMSKDGRRFLAIQRLDAQNRPAEIRVVLNWAEDVRSKMAAAAPLSRKTR